MSELNDLINNIKNETSQIYINKANEIDVMRCMLNDKDYSISVYDKNGYVEQRSPHEEAIKFIASVINRSTGLDKKDANYLAENFEFNKKDAVFLLNNSRDFISTYMNSGRKFNIMQTKDTEADIYTEKVDSKIKSIPIKDSDKKFKEIKTSSYTKLKCSSKCPRYSK